MCGAEQGVDLLIASMANIQDDNGKYPGHPNEPLDVPSPDGHLLFQGKKHLLCTPSGQAHEQNALPKNMEPKKRRMNMKKLPHMIPLVVASTIT